MSDDEYIDHAKLQQRYLIHYESASGSRFGSDVWPTLRAAEADADGYRQDGLKARVIKVTVEDGNIIAEWAVAGVDPATVKPGLYRAFWTTGGSSDVAVGIASNGERWYIATNWVEHTSTDWSRVAELQPVRFTT